jgi:hypothetical protein
MLFVFSQNPLFVTNIICHFLKTHFFSHQYPLATQPMDTNSWCPLLSFFVVERESELTLGVDGKKGKKISSGKPYFLTVLRENNKKENLKFILVNLVEKVI